MARIWNWWYTPFPDTATSSRVYHHVPLVNKFNKPSEAMKSWETKTPQKRVLVHIRCHVQCEVPKAPMTKTMHKKRLAMIYPHFGKPPSMISTRFNLIPYIYPIYIPYIYISIWLVVSNIAFIFHKIILPID